MSDERPKGALLPLKDERDVGGRSRACRCDQETERVPLDHVVERAQIGVAEVRVDVRVGPLAGVLLKSFGALAVLIQ